MRGSRKFCQRGSNFDEQMFEQIAFRWHADDGPTLNAGLVAAIFQGIGTCIRKPYIFVIFQGGSGPLSPFWIHT